MKTIQSVEKAINILNFIADNNDKYNLTEISKILNMPMGSLHSFIATLEKYNMIKKGEKTGKYCLGQLFFKYSLLSDKKSLICDIIKPYISSIRDKTNETVHTALPIENDKIIYIDKAESNHPFRLTSLVGGVEEAKNSAIGLVLYDLKEENEDIKFNTYKEMEYCLKYEKDIDAYCIGTKIKLLNLSYFIGLSIVVPSIRFNKNKEEFYTEIIYFELEKLLKDLKYNENLFE